MNAIPHRPALAAALAAAAACASQAQPQTPAESAGSAPAAQTVTVTGTKRKQLDQQATQSLTVLTPDDLVSERDAYEALLRLP